MSGWGGEGGGGGGGALFGEAVKQLRHGHTVAVGGGCWRGRRNSECALLERLSMAQLGVKRKCCGCICKSSKMEEEYERVKKLRKKSEPSWVLNPGPSDY